MSSSSAADTSNSPINIGDSLNGGVIAGIVIVIIVAVLGMAAAFVFLCGGCTCCCKKRRKEKVSDFLDDRNAYDAWSSKVSLSTAGMGYELSEPPRVATREGNMDFVMSQNSVDDNGRSYHQSRLSGWKGSQRV
ncbi:hypothetical protein TI39_contig345g00068 [Zymoseptoria brevis]|uniref:Uncharacterized protein n=1 Tax=Zymoseptoria brevis TaxID=1047168 RepID=A0A0F4GRW9_9PEZI|nr:hypothetical protein TI39_contig345g00068 [Zymoseptoria brevis]